MSIQNSNKTPFPIVEITGPAIHYWPSGSYYTLTGSDAPPPASYDIIIPRTISDNFVTNTGIQPYIRFELISGSRGAGPRSNRNIPWEYYIRFYTASHLTEEQLLAVDGNNDILGAPSESLYFTSSFTQKTWYRDVEYKRGMSALELRNSIFNILTGSNEFILGRISASKHQDEEDPETGFIDNFTCSLFYSVYKGQITEPEFFTGSLHPDLGIKKHTRTDGSGSEKVPAGPSLILASASMIMAVDPTDNVSFKMSIGTSSLAQSGSVERTILYASGGVGGQGRIGFGTKNPKTKFDIKSDGFKVRSEDGRRELIFEDDGRLSAKKFSGTATSESIGGIIQLSYTPGTFEEPTIAREGETIGTINWVDESLNKMSAELDIEDPLQKYHTSASVAQITSTVKFAEPEVGVIGNMELKVSPVPTAEAALEAGRRDSSRSTLLTFREINPLLGNAPVYFPYAISSSGFVYAKRFNDDGTNLNVPDYVFEPEYTLKPLSEVEEHILSSKHLPNVPSREDKEGWKELSMGDRDMKLLEKIEELTLYIIDLQKQINELKN